MIRASITALIASRGAGISSRNDAGVGSQRSVDIVGIDGDLAAGRVSSHVLVHDGIHALTSGLVAGEDGSRAKETTLFGRVEVELERVLGSELGVGENAESLEDDDDAGAVVVGARSTCGGRAAGRVIVGAHDNQVAAGTGDLGDDGGLVPRVGELGHGDGRVGRGNRDDGVIQPGAGLCAVGGLVVPVVEVGEGLQPRLGVGGRHLGEKGVDLGLVRDGGGIGDGLGREVGLGRSTVRVGEGSEDRGVLVAVSRVLDSGWVGVVDVGWNSR